MKLKIIKREYKEVETNLELPVYLYFQDELCNDELVKITEKEKINIKYDYNSIIIIYQNCFDYSKREGLQLLFDNFNKSIYQIPNSVASSFIVNV